VTLLEFGLGLAITVLGLLIYSLLCVGEVVSVGCKGKKGGGKKG
jgi:Na+-transporting methylmalonyl-CoA/oxaloacetate decarboxylase gamma subunit